MSQQQYENTVAQWREASEEAERIEAANRALQELQDAEFRAALQDKFPQLRAWPGKQT